jgi:hypothetical protein
MLELVTFERIARARMDKQTEDEKSEDDVSKTQAFNVLIGAMCKVC